MFLDKAWARVTEPQTQTTSLLGFKPEGFLSEKKRGLSLSVESERLRYRRYERRPSPARKIRTLNK